MWGIYARCVLLNIGQQKTGTEGCPELSVFVSLHWCLALFKLWLNKKEKYLGKMLLHLLNFSIHSCRADSRFAPSQWETALLCNDVSHWLDANLESVLNWYNTIFSLRTKSMSWTLPPCSKMWYQSHLCPIKVSQQGPFYKHGFTLFPT